jgi:hypothetical protein
MLSPDRMGATPMLVDHAFSAEFVVRLETAYFPLGERIVK